MNVFLCFLVCLHFSIGRYHRCGVPGSSLSNSSELKSFLLITCTDAPESTSNSRSSGLFEVDAGSALVSVGEPNVAFVRIS